MEEVRCGRERRGMKGGDLRRREGVWGMRGVDLERKIEFFLGDFEFTE
jgi:hypothetical protein